MTIDPSSYRRYDRYAQAVSAIDAQGAARVYETLKPRVNEADRNFGGTGNFDAELERAIVELLKVPVVEGDVPLRKAGIGYAFADPRLEALSPPQKQLLRMGPRTCGRSRASCARLRLPLAFRTRGCRQLNKNAGRMSPAGVAWTGFLALGFELRS